MIPSCPSSSCRYCVISVHKTAASEITGQTASENTCTVGTLGNSAVRFESVADQESTDWRFGGNDLQSAR